jgi:hypothetical protein
LFNPNPSRSQQDNCLHSPHFQLKEIFSSSSVQKANRSEMENKLRREARRFLEKAIMKYDGGRTGAITRKQMAEIIKLLLKEDPQLFNQDELENVINKYSKESSFIVFQKNPNPVFGQKPYEFVVDHEDDRLDFLAVQDITVHYMLKQEKKNNDAFLSKHLIRLHDFPTP